ncbi:DUF6925 family protein [Methylobacterium iners]|uniref:Uncharacterized protein n=1 Tax=Methylobacterium iners TaxID=418707 RepID=A0ABQ4S311_9HYPH|nr:hypothetical protein [Methylobacterium iners]GJD97520.1 hypothetical protein OCOJLMKI_4752 [Methylobacterium iners]
MTTPDADAVAALLRAALADPETSLSLGSFGALAEFRREPDEAATALTDERLGIATGRGAIALHPRPGLRPVAYETAFRSGWSHALALCLPDAACAMNGRTLLTELGPDHEAARPADRGGVLFDLGLRLRAIDACLRSRDPETTSRLRAACGRPFFDQGTALASALLALNADRVLCARIGRIEVFAAEPRPDGPRAYLVPEILRAGRTHAATAPIPAGLVPVAAIHPPHPCRDARGRPMPFDRARHDAFQALLTRWGDPDLLAVKHGLAEPRGRHARAARRAGERQAPFLASPPPKGHA